MFFITKKDSETGKKFQKICEKIDFCHNEAVKIAEKYGFKEWYEHPVCASGGIYKAHFDNPDEVDLSIWRKDPNNQGYIPRKNTKKGKKLYNELQNLPVVTPTELNLCIGWEKGIVHIGFKEGKEYFGFSTNSKYEIIIPKDCREITETEYNNI